MTRTEIETILRSFAKELGVVQEDIDRDANLFSEGIIDSMASIDYLIRIEERFGVKMIFETVQEYKLGTVTQMSRYLEKEIMNKGGEE